MPCHALITPAGKQVLHFFNHNTIVEGSCKGVVWEDVDSTAHRRKVSIDDQSDDLSRLREVEAGGLAPLSCVKGTL